MARPDSGVFRAVQQETGIALGLTRAVARLDQTTDSHTGNAIENHLNNYRMKNHKLHLLAFTFLRSMKPVSLMQTKSLLLGMRAAFM